MKILFPTIENGRRRLVLPKKIITTVEEFENERRHFVYEVPFADLGMLTAY